MWLHYRGVPRFYCSSNTTQPPGTELPAMLLGETYQVRCPIYQPNQKRLNLHYRGVAYRTGDCATEQDYRSRTQSWFIAQLARQVGLEDL